MIQQLFNELNYLHKEFDLAWTIGSGEIKNCDFGGIVEFSGDSDYLDLDNWIFSNDLETLLRIMIIKTKEKVANETS